jgi:glycosyltransferase involved in cell wall biosynthesis
MPLLFRMVQVLDWIIALSWTARVLVWRRMLPLVPNLGQAGYPHAGPLPSMTVIVPARNEADNIAATLRSLLAAEGVKLQIVAVDDRSTDQTGAVMEAMAQIERDAGRQMLPVTLPVTLEVLHVTELPPGWLGKTHAMSLAAQQATGEWLLFTDADVVFHRDTLRRALEYAIWSSADHMVLLPTILMRGWGERMMISFLQVLSIWAVRPWRVPNPKAKRDSVGVGAFNMIRREVYDGLGGWESLRMEVLEDLTLGRHVKQKGYAQRVALGVDMVNVRWARGAFGVVDNLTKNLFALFRFRPEVVFAVVCGVSLFTLFPLLACLAGPALWWPTGVMLIALSLAYQLAGKYQHFSAAQMLLFPAATFLLLYAMLRSMLLAIWRGGIVWRGTFYSLHDLRRRAGK